jgi:hypothetical protein
MLPLIYNQSFLLQLDSVNDAKNRFNKLEFLPLQSRYSNYSNKSKQKQIENFNEF